MNIKNRLQKITIILATFLILFNFMGGNVVRAAGLVDNNNNNAMKPSQGNSIVKGATITEAVQGTSSKDVQKAIMDELGIDEDLATEVMNNWSADKNYLTIDYNGGNIKKIVSVNKTEKTNEGLQQIKDGTFQKSLETKQDNAQKNVQNEVPYNDNDYWDPEAKEDKNFLESLLIVPTVGLITTCVDGVYKVFQNFILGTNTSIGSTITSALPWAGNHIVVKKDSSEGEALVFTADEASENGDKYFSKHKDEAIPIEWDSNLYHLPTMILTPAAIFEGKVAALNGNFFDSDDAENEIGGTKMSTVSQLKSTVSGWYITLRNIAVVGLLSVLIYIGIRIIISTSNSDKAKYKQFFMDWVIALCLIFFMHYIMSFIMTVTDSVTAMMASDQGEDGTYQAKEVLVEFGAGGESNHTYMYTSFAGVARMRLQYAGSATKLGYMVMYIAFVGYTVYFSVIYLKRILYLSFFTMIAPLVALTYPLDKIKDGKAQAFNFWFKEYIFYAMLQPLHLFLYTVLVKSAMTLAATNMIYAIVAMAFIVPAEKIVKSMFGIRGQTEGNLGGLMGLSAATHMFQLLRKPPKMPQGGGAGKGGASGDTEGITDSQNSSKFDSLYTMPTTTSNDNSEAPLSTTPGSNIADEQQMELARQERAKLEAEAKAEQERKAAEELARNQRAAAAGKTQNPEIPDGSAAGINTKEQKKLPTIKQLKNNAKTAAHKRLVAAGGAKGIAARAAKGVGKGLVKGYATAAGAVGLGAVGLGLGMVGGDLNNAWQGLAAGAGVGAYIGNNAGNGMLNTASATLGGKNALGSFASEVWNGEEESLRLREENAYMNDQSNIERIQSEHSDWDYEQIQEHAKREYNMQRETGIHDIKLANKAIKLEDELASQGSTPASAHDRAKTILQGTKVYDKSMFYNTKKLNEARETFVTNTMETSKVSREQAVAHANKVFKEIGQVYGVGKVADMPAWNEPKIDENAKNSGRVTSSVKNGGNNVKTPKKTPRKSNRKK